jgi:hypothetical protein
VNCFPALTSNLFLNLGACETAATAFSLATWLANDDMRD